MKLSVFQSDKGDCLLLKSAENAHMLIDGGMRKSFSRHVAPALSQLQKNKVKLNLVYVSHIDRDHISGVIQMMNNLVEWRVYKFHKTSPTGNRNWPSPRVKRPPEIDGIWHNAFHVQLGKNEGPIEDMLAANAKALAGFEDTKFTELSQEYQDLALSKGEAVELSRRVSPQQLNIPLNKQFGGKLILRPENTSTVKLGGMKIYILGPAKNDLTRLRRKWNKWLKSTSGARKVKKIKRRHQKDEQFLGLTDVAALLDARRRWADEISFDTNELGDRAKVTPPNLASLMLLVEEKGKRILFTGDGHWKDILNGLEHYNLLQTDGGLHVDLLKVQHHGSEYNANKEFCRRVTADHYVFCGNGAHENPDIRIIDLFVNSRIGRASEKSMNQQASNPCKFWFNSSSTYPYGVDENLKHMKKIENKMKRIKERSNDQISYRFLHGDKFDISV